MSFLDSLPIPSFDPSDTLKAKNEDIRRYRNIPYYLSHNGTSICLVNVKNEMYCNTDFYTIEREAVHCSMLLVEKGFNKLAYGGESKIFRQ